MEYANIVWGADYDSDVLKLENIHLDAMRLVTGAIADLILLVTYIISVHEEFGKLFIYFWSIRLLQA